MAISLAISFFSFGQKSKSEIDLLMLQAQRLEHNFKEKSAGEYYTIFTKYEQAAKAGNMQAMTKVGMLYMEGNKYLKQDFEKAAYYLEKSGKLGHGVAWFHLGQMYRAGDLKIRNYEKAYKAYTSGAALSFSDCIYQQALMLYKGYGCTQDYKHAAALFGAEANRGTSLPMFYYGVCLRNGFGVMANYDSAVYWLKKAAIKGSRDAVTELNNKFAECNRVTEFEGVNAYRMLFPEELYKKEVKIKSASEQKKNITGQWEGVIITYDWSGKNIVGTRIISAKVTQANDSVVISITEDGDREILLKGVIKNNRIEWKNETVILSTRYKANAVYYELDIDFLVSNIGGNTYLQADLSAQTANRRQEPMQPRKLFLKRMGFEEEIKTNRDLKKTALSNVTVFPSPFKDFFNVFIPMEYTGNLFLILRNQTGQVVYRYNCSLAGEGNSQIRISPPQKLSNGIYYLEVAGNGKRSIVKIYKN